MNEKEKKEEEEKVEEIKEEEEKEGTEEKKENKSFLKILLAFVIILLLITLSIPYWKIKVDPEPKRISIEELETLKTLKIENETKTSIEEAIKPEEVKVIVNELVSKACEKVFRERKICYAKAIYYFVRDNINYVSDPAREYFASPLTTLKTRAGDCDDITILLASMEEAIGIKTKLVFLPNHVYLQIYLPEALKDYKSEENWVSLDATCKTCRFGETPLPIS